jgi:hypothetical protein
MIDGTDFVAAAGGMKKVDVPRRWLRNELVVKLEKEIPEVM